jgi:hypothetical protein
MLLHRLLMLLPAVQPGILWVWYVLAAGVGGLFCVAGSRLSRMILVLAAVTVGAMMGKHVAGAFGYHPDPMAATIGGSVACALLMVFLHRFVIALGLSVLLAAWAGLGVWVHSALPTVWQWPTVVAGGPSFVSACSAQLPPEVAQWMTALAGLGFLAGLAIAALMPRVALPLFWSVLGTTILVAVALAYATYVQPHLFDGAPDSTEKQVGVVAGVALVGFLVQWWPRSRPASQGAPTGEPTPALA